MKPDLLLIGPLIAHAMAQLEDAYTVHRYDLAADKEALIAELAPRLTAIATRGDYPLPGTLMRRFPNVKIIASSGTGYDGVDVASARDAKILVVALPGGKGNQRFVDRHVIDALGPHGYLINISRGSNIDEPYLVDALVNKRLAGAGLDVFADEPRIPEALFGLDHVVLQPHAASGTHATRNALGQFVVDNLAAHFAGKALVSPVRT